MDLSVVLSIELIDKPQLDSASGFKSIAKNVYMYVFNEQVSQGFDCHTLRVYPSDFIRVACHQAYQNVE